MSTPRAIAFNLITGWRQNSTFPNLALKNALHALENPRDRRFVTALVYGVIERKITLDHFIRQCGTRAPESLEPPVLTLLEMGVYQALYMNVPPSAACNTTVELCKAIGHRAAAGYVNAVLRRAAAEKETLLLLKKADFSVRYSIDPALVDLLLLQYGKEHFIKMMEGCFTRGDAVTVFHNFMRCDEPQFLQALHAEGLETTPTELPHLFSIAHGFDIEASAAFQKGYYHVVGIHSAEAALLCPPGAALVLDLCAAPGGKTFILACRTQGRVEAFDLYTQKINALAQNARRLGHANLHASVGDASVYDPRLKESADFVLCDVPCSGLGMIARKPDIKYKRCDSAALTAVQRRILENGASYLKPGGLLIYSTCTIDRRENEQIVEAFLAANPAYFPDQSVLSGGMRTYLPGVDGDGFFIAAIRKG